MATMVKLQLSEPLMESDELLGPMISVLGFIWEQSLSSKAVVGLGHIHVRGV